MLSSKEQSSKEDQQPLLLPHILARLRDVSAGWDADLRALK